MSKIGMWYIAVALALGTFVTGFAIGRVERDSEVENRKTYEEWNRRAESQARVDAVNARDAQVSAYYQSAIKEMIQKNSLYILEHCHCQLEPLEKP